MTRFSSLGNRIRFYCFLALLASLLLAGAGLFCLKQAFSHQTLQREYLPLHIYERINEEEKRLLFSDKEGVSLLPLHKTSELILHNPSSRPFTFHLNGESIPLEREGLVSLSAENFNGSFAVSDGEITYYFVSEEEALQQALTATEPREIILQQDLTLSSPFIFSSPCRIDLRDHRLQGEHGLYYRSDSVGSLTVLSQSTQSLLLYADAPQTQIHASEDTFRYSKDLWDFYLKASSVNGRSCQIGRNPVTDEGMLRSLALSPLVSPTRDSYIEFCESFSLSEDLSFSCAYSLRFLTKPDFNGHTLSFHEENQTTIRIFTATAIDSSAICIYAPNAHLLWEGSNTPLTETICETTDVATINGEDPGEYRLGGNSQARLESFTLHHESFLSPLSLTQEGNLLVGTLDYLDSYYDLERVTPRYECTNGSLQFSVAHWNEDGTLDLTKRTVVQLTDPQGRVSRYRLQVQREYRDLPVIEIQTQDRAEVVSKTEYLDANIRIFAKESGFEDLENTPVQIRGRGNSTWKWEKKPYKLKFNEDISLFGLAPANEWALLSNYADKSLMRNRLAYEMAKELRFSYSPTQYCVDVFVNGEYQGVYTFGEHLEAAEGRIELDQSYDPENTGYLIEIGGVNSQIHKKGVDYFHAGTLRFALVKAPGQGALSSEQFDYISSLLIEADKAIVNGGDWRQYVDEESLIDWILLMELTNNTDCAYRRSCYFTKNANTKLMLGPVWDFDLAFGNFNRDSSFYDTWATTTDDDYVGNTWTAYLLQDRAFVQALYQRWNEIRDTLIQRAEQVINQTNESLAPSAIENFRRWDVLNIRTEMQRSDVVNYNTHEKQLQYLKDFLKKRALWMDKELQRLYDGGTYQIPVIPEED